MKIYFLQYKIVPLILLSLLLSCTEVGEFYELETLPTFSDENLSPYLYKKVKIKKVPKVKVVYDGIVKFEDSQHYNHIYNQLFTRYFIWNDRFSGYQKQKSDIVDSMAKVLKFNSEQPLEDFERLNGFISLRSRINEKIAYYYENYPEDSTLLDPEIHIVIDDVERSLINHHGEIMIGDFIYHYKDDGSIIWTKSFEELDLIRNLSSEDCKNQGFAGEYNELKKSNERFSFHCGDLNCGDYRVKWYVSFYNIQDCKAVVSVRSVSEKRDSAGNWQRYYGKMGVKVEGKVRDALKPERDIRIAYAVKSHIRSKISNQIIFNQNKIIRNGELMGCFKYNKNSKFYRYIR